MTQPQQTALGDTVQPQAPQAPASIYQARCDHFAARRDTYNRRSYRYANLSLTLIIAALLATGIWLGRSDWIFLVLGALLGSGFLVSFIFHGRVDRVHAYYAALWEINNEGLQRLQRDWTKLPLRQPQASPPEHNTAIERTIANDLDLLGHASLQHLLGTPSSPIGLATVQHWLLHPANPPTITCRQAAVSELASLIGLRDELALRRRHMASAQTTYERFLTWAESEPWLVQRPWLIWIARLLPIAMLALVAVQLRGLTEQPIWMGGIAAGLIGTILISRPIEQRINQVAERQQIFETYAELFRLIGEQRFTAPELLRLQSDLSAAGLHADQQMRRLGKIMPLADLRSWMFFYPIQFATLWNVHVLWLLERWQHDAGQHARRWLTALGEFEALVALATLAHDNPEWTFPEIITEHPPLLATQALGHPLLAPEVCIGNDLTIGPPGTFLLVTGSNMSGKSTLLRAIGVNIVLAQAGGPVCARYLRLPHIALATSMRVQDSLETGVSYFMAELRQLKMVVDRAQQLQAEDDRTLLFLLDEILHGTNTAERQIAARQVIRHLLNEGAMGIVSTHDLTLADDPQLAATSTPVHFTETFSRGPDGPTMHFDYTLRPGIATSTNALKLMEIVGLVRK